MKEDEPIDAVLSSKACLLDERIGVCEVVVDMI